MNTFVPTPISVADQDELRADARAEMFFALRKAFGERSKQCGIRPKDLSDILEKNKSYVSRVLNGSSGSIDYETLYVFLHALGYHLPLKPVPFEDLHAKKTNWTSKPSHDNSESNQKTNLYDLRYIITRPDESANTYTSTRRPRIKDIHKSVDSL